MASKKKQTNKIKELADQLVDEREFFDEYAEEEVEEKAPIAKKLHIKLSWKTALHVGLSLVIVGALVKFANLDVIQLIHEIKQTDLFWFGLTVAAFLIQIFTNAYRWNILTKLLNYDAPYMRAVNWYFQGQFSNSFLPTNLGGDALRSYKLGKMDQDWIRAASTVLAERLFGFVMMFSLLPIGLLLLSMSSVYAVVPEKIYWSLWGLFVVMVLGLVSYGLWSKIPLRPIQKIRFAVEEYLQCHKSLAQVIVWTFITHMFLILSNIFAAKAAGVFLEEIPVWYWLLLVPIGTFAAFAVPAMKGLGAREASYVYFLGLISISSEKSLAIAFIIYASMLVSSLPGISVVFGKLFKKS